MALTADQITAIAAAAINAAGLGATAEICQDNLYADNIHPITKNGLSLFNTATAAVSSDKRINLSTNNSQK
eukprot:12672129-Ditylum_brightwellii.AAC.1